jgi:hypothetical protein
VPQVIWPQFAGCNINLKVREQRFVVMKRMGVIDQRSSEANWDTWAKTPAVLALNSPPGSNRS